MPPLMKPNIPDATVLEFEHLVPSLQGDDVYFADGSLTNEELDAITNASTLETALETTVLLGEFSEKPVEIDSTTTSLPSRNHTSEGKRDNTIKLTLNGVSEAQINYFESPAFSEKTITIISVPKNRSRMVVFNGMKFKADWGGKSDELFTVTLSAKFAGITDRRIVVRKFT